MISRRDAAQRLDIPIEMAARHALPKTLTEEQMRDLEENPPAWLTQSRANRTGKRPTWVDLECAVCGYSEKARPKKWWPAFTFLICDHHEPWDLTPPTPEVRREEVMGIGSRFIGVTDTPRG